MNAKITALTVDQEILKTECLEAWRAHGLSTSRADKATAEKAIAGLYGEIGKTPPTFTWVASPKAAVHHLAKTNGGKPISYVGQEWWGQHESYWVAFYVFCRDVLGVVYTQDQSRRLDLWADISRSCCWWWARETNVVVCERPITVSMDDNRRLHSATGAAVSFEDGWGVYAWHGTRIPAEWIKHPDKVKVEDALTWPNLEQRRALAEIIGWKRVISALTPKVIDADSPAIGTLLEVDLPDAPRSRFLQVKCGTGRDFVLAVPERMKTAREANAWTYSLKAEDLVLEVRT